MPIVQALSGESTTVENMEIRRAGANILLSVSARPIWGATGNILYAVAVFSDITQRKIAGKHKIGSSKNLFGSGNNPG